MNKREFKTKPFKKPKGFRKIHFAPNEIWYYKVMGKYNDSCCVKIIDPNRKQHTGFVNFEKVYGYEYDYEDFDTEIDWDVKYYEWFKGYRYSPQDVKNYIQNNLRSKKQ